MRARSILAVLLLLLSCMPSLHAEQDSLAAAAEGLKDRGFGALIEAVEAIAATGDERAGPLLRALGDGNLYIAKDAGALVIDAKDGTVDALTGELLTIDAASLAKIKTNNRLRGVIRTALGSLTLASPNAVRRLEAAQSIRAARDASSLELLEAALAEEADPAVKIAMQQARAAILLTTSAAQDDQLQAIKTIRALGGQEGLALLSQAASMSEGAVKRAASEAMADLSSDLALWANAQNVIYGLSLGSVLLLAAIGLAITFGVMGVINMAHGEMVMVGAYVTFLVQETIRTSAPGLFEWSLLFALPLAFCASGALGVALERGVIRFLYGRPLETLLATWGISLILQQAVRSTFGPNNREVGNPDWMSGSLHLGELTLTWNRLYIIAFALLVFALLHLIMQKTHFGLQMRAVVQNRRMAGSMGIRTKWIDALTFGLGCGIAGIAGVAISQIDNVSPNLGQSYIIDSFMVVVFGGVGNIWGTLVAAMSLGIANKFLEPFAGAVLGKILVLVFIILFIQKRPRGLFALRGRAVET